MNKSEFSKLLSKATKLSFEFAKELVTNELPARYLYLININGPYEDLIEDEETFPEMEMGEDEYSAPLTHEQVIEKLYKNQKVPVWVDISVFKTDEKHTYFTLLCCNRFSAKDELYYYLRNGTGPFGVKSPVYPPGWDDKQGKFDLEIRQRLFYSPTILQRIKEKIFG